MGLALTASVGVAWWIVRDHPGTRGTQIISQIRDEGLGAHWRGFKQRWFLRQDPTTEQPNGWRCEIILAGDDGSFHGLNVQRDQAYTWERWKLNRSATEGTYHAGQVFSIQGRLRPRNDTEIQMDHGIVTVRQRGGLQFVESQAPTPDNYVPEGMLPLVRRVVALKKTHAKVKVILNQLPPDPNSGQPRFVDFDMRCLPHPSKGATDIRVAASYGGQPLGEEGYATYAFDEGGTLRAVYQDKHEHPSERIVKYPEIRKAFPKAGTYIRSVIDELDKIQKLKFPIPESRKPPKPSKPAAVIRSP